MYLTLLLCGLYAQATDLPPVDDATPPPQPQATFEPPVAAPPAAQAAVVLPPEIEDQLIFMQARTVARVQSNTGPFTVRVGGQMVGQQLVVEDEQVPVIGRARAPLEWPEFYVKVGRPDLAKSYAQRMLGHNGMLLGGLGLSVGSGLLMIAGMVPGLGLILWRARTTGAQRPQFNDPWFVGGLGLILAGAAAMTVAILAGSTLLWLGNRLPLAVATPQENVKLMEDYNTRVTANAHSTPVEPSPVPPAAPAETPQ